MNTDLPIAKPPVSGASQEARPNLLRQIAASREFNVIVVLFLLGAAMLLSSARTNFYSARNFQIILLQVALLAIFAIGETVVIVTGGIDLSLGSMIAFTGMLVALITTTLDQRMFTGAAVAIAIVLTLLIALGIGALHAILIHKVGLPAFVVTLVTLLTLRSQSAVMRHQQQIPIPPTKYPLFDWLANGTIFGSLPIAIPVPAVLMVILAVIVHLILSRARMGRYLYSVGSNEQATMLSGVNVFRVKLFAYGLSAMLGGLAGILYAGFGGQGDPKAGDSYELDAVAASVVGGASLTGGQGSVSGTVLGAILFRTIFSCINLVLDNPSQWRGTVVGVVLLLAVLVTAIRQRKSRTL